MFEYRTSFFEKPDIILLDEPTNEIDEGFYLLGTYC